MEPATYLASFYVQFRHGSKAPPIEAFTQTGTAQSRPGGAPEPNVLDAAGSKGSSTVLDDCWGESDALSDAGTYHICERPEAGSEEGEEDGAVAELFGADGVRKKIEVLAAMVGMGGEHNDEPGAVLGEVVRALRELQMKAELAGCRSCRGDRKQ